MRNQNFGENFELIGLNTLVAFTDQHTVGGDKNTMAPIRQSATKRKKFLNENSEPSIKVQKY
ncbi:hypothetical protein JCM19240_6299 [Vibrio maritimus]|uniref:Uncharacterized protein n=1 Tax=Vibrio maritimus TaxID=990268 RepID=A0A090TNT8_9VIBR|nr:hypothetical protein JCM19240_6299 [Vibrio maritimus]